MPAAAADFGRDGGAGGSSDEPGFGRWDRHAEGQVFLLTDASFVQGSLLQRGATVTADGANGSPVTAIWEGVDPFDPFVLEGVARVTTNWVSVEPDVVGGDALPTYQAVQTYQVTSANLGAGVRDALWTRIFNAVSTLRSDNSGQVIAVLSQCGDGRAALGFARDDDRTPKRGSTRRATGWMLDDGTAVTDQSGLVVFGNVEPADAGGTQTGHRDARRAPPRWPRPLPGNFAVKVVQGAVSIAALGVQL